MSLFVDDAELFDIEVNYTVENGVIKFHEEGCPGCESATFSFKRPNWNESKTILSASVLVDAASGRAIVDPYKLMDMRIRLLLKKWSLEQPLLPENIAKLDPNLMQYLYSKVEERLSPPADKEQV